MKIRIPISTKIVDEILVKNKHTCCVCQDINTERSVQINHINGKNSDNRPENLAVLCLDHHAQATIGLNKGHTLGRKLTPRQIRIFKKQWESACLNPIKEIFPSIYYKKKNNISIRNKVKIHLGGVIGLVLDSDYKIVKIHLDPIIFSNESNKNIIIKKAILELKNFKGKKFELLYKQTIQKDLHGNIISFPQHFLPFKIKRRDSEELGIEFISYKPLEFLKGHYDISFKIKSSLGNLKREGFFIINDYDLDFINQIKDAIKYEKKFSWLKNRLVSLPVIIAIHLIEK